MDVEFHYYVTYLIATRARIHPADARIVAYASQYVDDNAEWHLVRQPSSTNYANSVSQTIDLRSPDPELRGVYPLFHFIPGDSDPAPRKDGKPWNSWTTTPNNRNAQMILKAAIDSGNLYRLGIACHAYVDTWAHQNFIGAKHPQNGFPNGPLPDVGHADAGHDPDAVGLVWRDPRLASQDIDNTRRFLDAAGALCEMLNGDGSDSLQNDLHDIFALPSGRYRIRAYQSLATQDVYGASHLPEYRPHDWRDRAIRRFADEGHEYWEWVDFDRRIGTDWYKFQSAVSAHKEKAREILLASAKTGGNAEELEPMLA